MVKLNKAEIAAALEAAPGWALVDGKLRREFKFGDFLKAMEFVNRVAVVAEDADHHPDIDIRYNRVRLGLVTHDAGGVTASDTSMAARLDLEIAFSMYFHTFLSFPSRPCGGMSF